MHEEKRRVVKNTLTYHPVAKLGNVPPPRKAKCHPLLELYESTKSPRPFFAAPGAFLHPLYFLSLIGGTLSLLRLNIGLSLLNFTRFAKMPLP
jgi:hypothetical protein